MQKGPYRIAKQCLWIGVWSGFFYHGGNLLFIIGCWIWIIWIGIDWNLYLESLWIIIEMDFWMNLELWLEFIEILFGINLNLYLDLLTPIRSQNTKLWSPNEGAIFYIYFNIWTIQMEFVHLQSLIGFTILQMWYSHGHSDVVDYLGIGILFMKVT